jgi:hypothetical protein
MYIQALSFDFPSLYRTILEVLRRPFSPGTEKYLRGFVTALPRPISDHSIRYIYHHIL